MGWGDLGAYALVGVGLVLLYLGVGLLLTHVAARWFNPFFHDEIVISWGMVPFWPVVFPLMALGHTTHTDTCWRCRLQQWRVVNFHSFTRLVVIDECGRVYERRGLFIKPSIQDRGRTLKLFVVESSRAARERPL